MAGDAVTCGVSGFDKQKPDGPGAQTGRILIRLKWCNNVGSELVLGLSEAIIALPAGTGHI